MALKDGEQEAGADPDDLGGREGIVMMLLQPFWWEQTNDKKGGNQEGKADAENLGEREKQCRSRRFGKQDSGEIVMPVRKRTVGPQKRYR